MNLVILKLYSKVLDSTFCVHWILFWAEKALEHQNLFKSLPLSLTYLRLQGIYVHTLCIPFYIEKKNFFEELKTKLCIILLHLCVAAIWKEIYNPENWFSIEYEYLMDAKMPLFPRKLSQQTCEREIEQLHMKMKYSWIDECFTLLIVCIAYLL